MTGKTTILLKLMRNMHLFDYKIDKVLLFYQHSSSLYDELAKICETQQIKLTCYRYDDTPLNMESLEAARGDGTNTTLCLFDDATHLVQTSAAFNQLIHVARHSRLVFVLLLHGIVYSRPQARTMVCK